MKPNGKTFISLLVLISCLLGLTACGADGAGETGKKKDDETEVSEPVKAVHDHQAVDEFLTDNLERLENSEYTLTGSEEFPGCGPNIMFVVVNSVNRDPEFVRSSSG